MTARFAPLPALFVSYAGVLGGAERLLLDMAAGLAETPTLACPEGPLAERARDQGIHVLAIPERPLELRASARDRAGAPLRIAAHARELYALVRDLQPDVVVAWGMRPLLAAAAALRGRGRQPRLIFQHNDLLPGPAIARAVRAAARRADTICTLSECIARELELPAHLINPGVDLERLQASPVPDAPPEVLVLGAIVGWKRPDLALEAVALAARELPDLRLRVAGAPLDAEGERLRSQLGRRAAQPDLEGRVELSGPVDAAGALARATCLLHCAEREPFGLVVAEALASGRPAVVPASCGPAEIVDESCGRRYTPGDAQAAAHALVDALRDAPQLGAAGRARAEEKFDVREARARYAEVVAGRRSQVAGGGEGIALVTVTHNSRRDVERLLTSARAHLPDARVIVVDSGSSDGSAEVVRGLGAHVIELDDNVGFGRASNIGVAQVAQPVTVLVNPDVELVDGSLGELAEELRLSDRILAPLVLQPDGSRQDSAQVEPGSGAAFAIALVPPAVMPQPLRTRACPWTSRRPRHVGWAVGCCLAARTKTLRRLGPFDERIFMYAEDLELGLRASDEGVETWFWPQARVIHYGAHSSEVAFGGEPIELLARQRAEVVAERRGEQTARRDRALQALTFLDRIVLKTLTGRDTMRERAQLRALR
jgi:N-acetylglucosaminyl-diphospho-decaprenol L-rhamnosyltransferase